MITRTKNWLCMECKGIVQNRKGHVAEKHPGAMLEGDIPNSTLKYLFMGVD
jgi:hypothetical protein